MDDAKPFLSELGLLALGSRTRALSERLYAVADEVYRAQGSPLQGRWFPLLRLLLDRGPQTVGSIAGSIGQTHSAVSQLADKLVREGWLRVVADAADKRRRRLALTARSETAIREVRPAWRAIDEVLAERCQAAGIDVLSVLDRFERVVDPTLGAAIVERCAAVDRAAVRIVPFAPGLREHFYRLNAAWLQKYFYLEEVDHRVLSNPEREILAPGGAILFALIDDVVVGTCALKQESPATFELTKMAVDERHQRLGLGRRLLEAAIAEFKRRKGKTLFLESSTRLTPALRLYESMGFAHQPTRKPDSRYSRSDVYMIWREPRSVRAAKRPPATPRGGRAPGKRRAR
jgi:DNA-binding MarR family transcriptional regulator/ribosomal protein S18 acetylase RimI-like enzyme